MPGRYARFDTSIVGWMRDGIPDRPGHPPSEAARLGVVRVRNPLDRRPAPPPPVPVRAEPVRRVWVPRVPSEAELRELRVRAVRVLTASGIKQTDIAALLHLNQSTVSTYLRRGR